MRATAILLALSLLSSCSAPPRNPPQQAEAFLEGGAEDTPSREAIVAAKWRKLVNAPAIHGKQDDLFFVTPQLGWSVNGEGRIFRTEDGGETWQKLIEKPGTFFRSILMLSETRGFAGNIGTDYFPGVTDTQPLYETSDRGATWTAVSSVTGPTPKGICNMQRLDAEHIYAVGRVGGPSFILSSSDGGVTWTSRDLSSLLAMLIDVRFTSPSEGIVVGMNPANHCAVFRTTDSGTTWNEVFAAQNGALCWKISFPSANVGYISIQGGETSSFAKTIDGGKTWTEKNLIEGPFNGLGAGFITEDIGWLAGREKALRTTDGGETWEVDPNLGPAINRFRFVDKHTAYAIGTTIYKLSIP